MPLKGTEGSQFKVWLGRTSTYTGYPVFFFKEFSFGATVVTIHRMMYRKNKSDNSPEEDLEKSGYKLNMKYKSLVILLYIWLHMGTQIIGI
jgi:hypothetical protein